ncbi:MAG TPA: hypothetical protein VF277_02520, partial [Steroidobacteraceae bacterium]
RYPTGPLMPLTSLRNLLLPGLLLASLAGCGTNHSACFDNMDYQTAINRPRLQMPEGVPGSERLAPLAIPTVGETTKLEPQPRCIDEPPSYFGRKGAVADPAEEVVNAWARAWAEKRADAVVGLYSSTFEATGEGGSAAYIDQRRQQVTTGRSPAAVLEDMSVTTVSGDKRVVTFVQRFGDDRVRKELTLVHEPLGWRIVAERTLEVL